LLWPTWTPQHWCIVPPLIMRCRRSATFIRRRRIDGFFREHVFRQCEVWGAVDDSALLGMIAFREDWIDQLYVLPHAQGHGIGTELLKMAKGSFGRLQLWTFQRNRPARRFYEGRDFVLVEETDGAQNEEKVPDARYRWVRP
jgi:GNAT superfamily N-acetyltransferase